MRRISYELKDDEVRSMTLMGNPSTAGRIKGMCKGAPFPPLLSPSPGGGGEKGVLMTVFGFTRSIIIFLSIPSFIG